MTIDKAFEILDPEEWEFLHNWDDLKAAAVIAREALKKQKPMKVKIKADSVWANCPSCNFELMLCHERQLQKYCMKCGQLLDWNIAL